MSFYKPDSLLLTTWASSLSPAQVLALAVTTTGTTAASTLFAATLSAATRLTTARLAASRFTTLFAAGPTFFVASIFVSHDFSSVLGTRVR
jgi:hypothetical protein